MPVTFQEHRLGSLTSLGAQVTLPATYTINIWVKNVTLPGQEWSNLYLQNSGYKYILDAGYGAIGAGTGPTRLAVSAADPLLVADTFHLVSCVFDGTTIEYYVNGVSIGSTTPAAAAPTVIDVLNGPASDAFAAEVKDMRVYSGVATAGEILASYNAGDGDLSLIAKYTLDTDVSDSVGSFDGSSHGGSSFETANSREAFRLTADGDYAQIPESINIGSSGPYTFSVWVKPDNFDSYQTLISDHVYGSTYPSFMVEIMPTSGNVRVRHYNSNSASVQLILSTGALVAEQWNLVTVTWDSSSAAVYIDGALDNSGALTHVPWNSSAPYRVGADTYPNIHVRGLMDDLRIWSRALGASEIATLHSSTQALTDGLVAKYALDTDATDSVGSNDGTNANVTFADGAAQFNGSNARFTLASEPFTASDADYTISVWAKHDNVSNTQRLLGWGDLNGRYFVGYHTGLDKIYIGMGDIDIVPSVAYKPAAGQVEHWVFSNSGNTTKFYKDGVLIDTVVHGATGAISAGVRHENRLRNTWSMVSISTDRWMI